MNNSLRLHQVKLLMGIISLLMFIFGCDIKHDYLLVEKGTSPYAIVISLDASPSEKHAAQELQTMLKEATGAQLPLVDEKSPRAAEPMRIFVGSNTLTNELIALGTPVNWEKLGDEGFILRTVKKSGVSPDIIIAGGKLRGTMYGVYTFLDRLGFRWYTNRKTWYPHEINMKAVHGFSVNNSLAGTLRFPNFDKEIIPPFMYREPSIYEAFDDDWAARNRANMGFVDKIDETHGGSAGIYGVHTFDHLIPRSLFKEHPEYFPLIGGKRVTGYVQRCLTAPGLVEETAKNLIAWIDSNPDGKIFSLSPSDTEMLCECPKCKKITEDEGSPSGLYLDFVNKVAEIVEKKYPDKYISTLAYGFTVKPPKTVKPRHNVIIRLCPIEICFSHPFTECTEIYSVNFSKYLKDWSQITDRMIIWHYNTAFESFPMPFPNFKEFTADIKTYYENGVKGIFFEGSESSLGGGDADLRAWVMARLLWDPYLNPDEVVNEWLHGVYGHAFEPMRAYYDLMHEQVAAPDRHIHTGLRPTKEFWPEHVVASMDSLHEEALSLVEGNITATYYIKKNRMAVMFLQQTLGSGRLEIVDGAYRPVGNRVTVDDFDRFAEYIKQFGVTYIGNTWSSHRLKTSLRQRVETHEVVTIENEDIKLDVVPNLGGRIVSLIHKKTGTELLNRMSPEDNFYPLIGGYEEMTALTWGCTGYTNSYEAEVKGNSITLNVLTEKGLRFKRTITLPSKGSMITFSSWIINESASPQTYKLVCRMHLKADPDMTEISARSANGSFIKPTPTEEKTAAWPFLTFSRRYDGVNKPTGAWRLKNTQNGLTIENRFENTEVEGCHLITEKKMNLALMEIHTAEHEVKPGDRIILGHTWEIK